MIVGLTCIAAFFATYAVTAGLIDYFRTRQIVDRPNSRSSHTIPTPRGGGLSMVVASTSSFIVFYAAGLQSAGLTTALVFGGLGVAAVGFWDDVRSAPIAVRMTIHLGAASFAVYCLGGLAPSVQVGNFVFNLGAIGPVLCVLGIVWSLNLFNFMDGIDGIAASEAACILLGAACLGMLVLRCSPTDVAPELVAGAACLGFLRWNWPPAAIFMGDVGSGYLGYAIAVIAIGTSQSTHINIYAWLILGGVFLADATLTVCRRLLRGERIHQAHRIHAYQWLARRWDSHLRVTAVVIIINIAFLFPLAALAIIFPRSAFWICFIALAPLTVWALFCGSGRPE